MRPLALPCLARRRFALLSGMVLAGVLSKPLRAQSGCVQIEVLQDGTFDPGYVEVDSGSCVTWRGLGRTDSITAINYRSVSEHPEVCLNGTDSSRHALRRRFDPNVPNELSGPPRRGFSGIWVLGPEGAETSSIEIPSAEALLIDANATVCADLDAEREVFDSHGVRTRLLQYHYAETFVRVAKDGEPVLPGTAEDLNHVTHRLCAASSTECDGSGANCEPREPDPLDPLTVAPGVYLSGLLEASYANPDVTGVVLRFNWKDLQYDDAGTIRFNWTHLDRELERAVRHGKYVTLDVRAGMFGTPLWIFDDYVTAQAPADEAWCAGGGARFAAAPRGAGEVVPIEFRDHYEEQPPGPFGCGSTIRIGAPGDPNYRALYTGFIAELARHVASDTRWFQTVAHVKVSGANLRTSEAELPHHCDDLYLATADHENRPKNFVSDTGDRVLDVLKGRQGNARSSTECWCNSQIWWEHGYTPEQLYTYYAEVEGEISRAFFGQKSLGYQLLQAGFPRVDAANGFYGDHLYRERLVDSSDYPGVLVNACHEQRSTCDIPGAFEELAPGASYCSTDTAAVAGLDPFHCALALEPIVPMPGQPGLAAWQNEDRSGVRYPLGTDQADQVLAQGSQGRFGNPPAMDHVDLALGKLFIPQHSGLQPLPQEQAALGFNEFDRAVTTCAQQREPESPALVPDGIGELGPKVARFPIRSSSARSSSGACPNFRIVDAGKDTGSDSNGLVPAQLTGFQTNNGVRDLPELESTLFNLTYNSNAVFIELYEDVVWRAGVARGTGPLALPLDAGTDLRSPASPNRVCEYDGSDLTLCYSKNLAQWGEELHYRRARLAQAPELPPIYSALANPFPTTHTISVTNSGRSLEHRAYINPSHCDTTRADPNSSGAPSSRGVIAIKPAPRRGR